MTYNVSSRTLNLTHSQSLTPASGLSLMFSVSKLLIQSHLLSNIPYKHITITLSDVPVPIYFYLSNYQ